MSNPTSEVSGEVKIMAGIGHVCVQWARLEMGWLGLIYVIEGIPAEKGHIIFGGLDMLPRANMAINLARHAKLPQRLVKRMTEVRKALQDGVSDRRNQAVHGAHRDMQGDETTLTMVRWPGDKRHKRITMADLAALGVEIHALGNEVWSIMEDFVTWKFGPHRQKDLGDTLAQG